MTTTIKVGDVCWTIRGGFRFVVARFIENGEFAVDDMGYICPVSGLKA